MEKTNILVATHKRYKMPKYKIYLPIHVGKKGKESIGFKGDDTGKNISEKNPYFCELTGIYWAWKNLKSDYVGLAHYRRHFKGNKKSKDKFEQVINEKEVMTLLKYNDIILPKKRNYYIFFLQLQIYHSV